MNFVSKKIEGSDRTVADKLKQTREQKSLSLKEISKKLNIKYEYLDNLEKGRYDQLPEGIYEKTFLKKYARVLGLNYKELEKSFLKEKGVSKMQREKDVFSKKKLKSYELLVFPKIVKSIIIIIVAGVFFVYIGFYLKISFSPPQIEIMEPIDNLVTENSFVYIIGKTNRETEVTINNELILKDNLGNFNEKVNLKKGLNTITISAKNRYSQKKIIEKQILVK